MSAKSGSEDPSPPPAPPSPPPLDDGASVESSPSSSPIPPSSLGENAGGILRGIAASMRGSALSSTISSSSSTSIKSAIRAVGQARPLAFASEGAVAGETLLPRWLYGSMWGLSISAICADVYVKYDDAPRDIKRNTVLYWMAFHVPASLIVPAMIVHRVAHLTEDIVRDRRIGTNNNNDNHNHNNKKNYGGIGIGGKNGIVSKLSPRARALAPVMAAMISIIPVVPMVDRVAESIMEPTLGRYLGLEFRHHE
ncbi:hypothetical protein ACHAXA_006881 [Cyclostephanos tholiformis]|uniref:Mitochondrial fission process protein 1 n=1 Tax=Cyclostephanos tholiformis TaxID=382380 RepID=A0ABD3SDJ2_9STRA